MSKKPLRGKPTKSLHSVVIASALGASISFAMAGMATADPLTAASFSQSVDVRDTSTRPQLDNFACSGGDCMGNGVGTLSIGSSSTFSASGIGTVTLNNLASSPLTISASASGKAAVSSEAQGEADYFIKVVGTAAPNQTVAVQVDTKVHADVSVSDPSDESARVSAKGRIDLFNPIGQTVQPVKSVGGPNDFVPSEFTASAGSNCPGGSCISIVNFNGTLLYLLQPNVLYQVSVFVDASTSDSFFAAPGSSFETANASVDPHFFLDDPNFQLLLSPDISNLGPAMDAVPEASTWTMMILGFVGLGFIACRRKNAASGQAVFALGK